MSIKLTGHHMANRHPVTGVRYTIYHINNDLHPEVWEDIYRDGVNLSDKAVMDELRQRVERALEELPEQCSDMLEDLCDQIMDRLADNDHCIDEPIYEGETDGIKWQTSWLGGAPHLIVVESPYYGVGRECSPCVPNAVNGSSITTIFSDEDAAGCHASVAGAVYGYALPTTWLRDKED